MREGFRFETNRGIGCVVIDNPYVSKYIIIDMVNFKVIAGDSYDNIEKLVETVKEKY